MLEMNLLPSFTPICKVGHIVKLWIQALADPDEDRETICFVWMARIEDQVNLICSLAGSTCLGKVMRFHTAHFCTSLKPMWHMKWHVAETTRGRNDT